MENMQFRALITEVRSFVTRDIIRLNFQQTQAYEEDNIFFSDVYYVCVDYYFLYKFLAEHRLSKLLNDFNTWHIYYDCDDFSQLLQSHLKMRYSSDLSQLNEQIDGYGIGEIWYRNKKNKLHSINVVILGYSNFVFVEPQTESIIELTPEEFESIYYIRF